LLENERKNGRTVALLSHKPKQHKRKGKGRVGNLREMEGGSHKKWKSLGAYAMAKLTRYEAIKVGRIRASSSWEFHRRDENGRNTLQQHQDIDRNLMVGS